MRRLQHNFSLIYPINVVFSPGVFRRSSFKLDERRRRHQLFTFFFFFLMCIPIVLFDLCSIKLLMILSTFFTQVAKAYLSVTSLMWAVFKFSLNPPCTQTPAFFCTSFFLLYGLVTFVTALIPPQGSHFSQELL